MRRIPFTLASLALISAALGLALQGSNLYINGALASKGVIERNGVTYVPVKDFAAALKLSVQKTARGYELVDAGGANQVEGLTGKIGDVLWNGFARFTVLKVTRAKSYTYEFSPNKTEVRPSGPGKDLVVVQVRIKNGLKSTVLCSLRGGADTALADTGGHSYEPWGIDAESNGPNLLPGAAVDFVLVFDVPESAQAKDLVYQLTFYSSTPGADKKRFRVSLAQ